MVDFIEITDDTCHFAKRYGVCIVSTVVVFDEIELTLREVERLAEPSYSI